MLILLLLLKIFLHQKKQEKGNLKRAPINLFHDSLEYFILLFENFLSTSYLII
jgi:hypothetical protein